MNKQILNVANSMGLNVEKNKACGVYKDYSFTLIQNNSLSKYPVVLNVNSYQEEGKVNSFIQELNNSKVKGLTFIVTKNKFGFGISFGPAIKMDVKILEFVEVVINLLQKYEFKTANFCPYCGEELNEEKEFINEFNVTIHKSCKEAYNTKLGEENAIFNAQPNNYLMGFVGAFLGALVGGVLLIILEWLGFVAAISSFVGLALASTLYVKFGGKQNKMMICIVFVTTVAVLIASWFIAILVTSKAAATTYNLDMTGFEVFKYCMANSDEYRSAIYFDLTLQAIFMALGMGYSLFVLIKSIKRQQTILKKIQ